jgi:pyruvate dehydrogenase E2 component (dihydrolipoamide acetyltransferase)
MKAFRLPDLGEGLHEAQIMEWHARPGDEIKADAPLLSVETDKAVTEVPSPWSGRISRLCAEVGDIVKVGSVVVEYEGGEQESVPPPPKAPEPKPVSPPAPSRSAGRAMPAVRLLAKELGIDIAGLRGSGPEGAVLAGDVAKAFRAAVRAPPASRPAIGGEDYVTLTGLRRSMAQNMARAGREVVPATVHEEADLGHWPNRSAITLRLVRAIAAAIAAEPILNASYDAVRGLMTNEALHLGIAVDSKDGLLVPVLRDAATWPQDRLGPELERLIEAARARRMSADDLKGATFTLSNYGMIAGLHATPVVIPPQLAILGAGRLFDRYCMVDGEGRLRPILPLSLTYDHRFITGGEAARFIRTLIEDLERPQ